MTQNKKPDRPDMNRPGQPDVNRPGQTDPNRPNRPVGPGGDRDMNRPGERTDRPGQGGRQGDANEGKGDVDEEPRRDTRQNRDDESAGRE